MTKLIQARTVMLVIVLIFVCIVMLQLYISNTTDVAVVTSTSTTTTTSNFEIELSKDLQGSVLDEQVIQFGIPPLTDHELRDGLDKFMSVYKALPRSKVLGGGTDYAGGMTLPHIFATWSIINKIKPRMVIESGIWKGMSTYIIASALDSGSRVVSLDPKGTKHKFDRVDQIYLTGPDFKDFTNLPEYIFYEGTSIADQNIAGRNRIPSDQIVVFIDDHQSAIKRIWQGLAKYNIKRYIIEDNYPLMSGDNYSLNSAFHRSYISKEGPLATVTAFDNFAKEQVPLRWDQHLAISYFWRQMLESYQIIPPLSDKVFETPRHQGAIKMHPELADIKSLFTESELLSKYPELKGEPHSYTFLAYAQVKSSINSKE
jgi:hypothetical protein